MSSPSENYPEIPFQRVSQLVRQVTHDVRNGLNVVDLQATLLSEIVADAETRSEVMRLRGMIGNVTKMLETLSSEFQGLSLAPIACEAGPFVEDAKSRFDKEHADRMHLVGWTEEVGDAWIEIDMEAVLQSLGEMLNNAFVFGIPESRIEFTATVAQDAVRFSVHEQRPEEPQHLEKWGREPFLNVRSGGYGLGLFRVRLIAEQHGGELRHTYDASRGRLTTTLSIPVTKDHG